MNMDDEEWQPPTAAELKVLQAKRERSDRISKIMGDYLLKGYKMLGACCSKCGTILLRDRDGVDYCIACSELDSDTDKDDPALSDSAARKQAAEQEQRDDTEDSWVLPQQPIATSQQQPATTVNRTPSTSAPEANFDEPKAQTNGVKPRAFPSPADPWEEDVCHSVSDLPATGSGFPTIPLQVTARSKLDSQVSGQYESLQEGKGANSNEYKSLSNCVDTKLVLKEKIQWATMELRKSSSLEYDVQLCNLIKASAQALAALNEASG